MFHLKPTPLSLSKTYYLINFNYLFVESFQTTMDIFGSLDIVINNAGIMNDRFWELEVDVNLVNLL